MTCDGHHRYSYDRKFLRFICIRCGHLVCERDKVVPTYLRRSGGPETKSQSGEQPMNHAEIAAMIRQHAPNAIPESIVEASPFGYRTLCVGGVVLDPDIAEAVLIKAMVVDGRLNRWPDSWGLSGDDWEMWPDTDHGGILGACFAAWKYARGIE